MEQEFLRNNVCDTLGICLEQRAVPLYFAAGEHFSSSCSKDFLFHGFFELIFIDAVGSAVHKS